MWLIRLLMVLLLIWLGGCARVPQGATTAPTPSATPAAPAAPTPPAATPQLRASSVALNDQPLLEARQPGAPAPVPTPTIEPGAALGAIASPARLVIEAIGLDQSIQPVGLDGERMPIVPNHNVGWYQYSASPGSGENIVLWGHVLRFRSAPTIPAPFARLHELSEGALITLVDAAGGTHHYTVKHQVLVAPERVDYMLPKGSERLTLISCFGDLVVSDGEVDMTRRLITIAEPVP